MRAALRDLQRRADNARRLARGASSDDIRDNLLEAARDYERQVRDLEKALERPRE